MVSPSKRGVRNNGTRDRGHADREIAKPDQHPQNEQRAWAIEQMGCPWGDSTRITV